MATQDETGIFVTIRFWTDFEKDGKKVIIPKQAWAAGSLRVRTSKMHGITSGESIMFNNLSARAVNFSWDCLTC